MKNDFPRDLQYYKFCFYGFFKNLRFFDPFILLYFLQNGLQFVQVGLLFSIREIVTNIFEIPSGIWADSLGRRQTMIFCFIAYIFSFVIFYFFNDFLFLALGIALFGIGEAFRSGTHKAMILEYLKIKNIESHKAAYYGHTRAFSQFGSAISSLIAGLLVFWKRDYRIIFMASTIPYLLDLVLIISYPKELDGKCGFTGETGFLKSIGKELAFTIKTSIKFMKNFRVLSAVLSFSVYDAFFKIVKDYLQPLLKSYGMVLVVLLSIKEKQAIPLFIGIVYFIIFLFATLASRKSAVFGKTAGKCVKAINFLYLAGTLVIILSGFLFTFKIFLIVLFLFVIFYIIMNLRKPLNVAYLSGLVDKKIMATALSVESQAKSILIVIFAPLIGFIADKFSIGYAFMGAGFIMLLLYPLIYIRKPAHEKCK